MNMDFVEHNLTHIAAIAQQLWERELTTWFSLLFSCFSFGSRESTNAERKNMEKIR